MSAPTARFSDSLLSLAVARPVKLGYRSVFAHSFSIILLRLQLGVGGVGEAGTQESMACMTFRSKLKVAYMECVSWTQSHVWRPHSVENSWYSLYCLCCLFSESDVGVLQNSNL